jgi:hypothetical protein
MRRLAVVQDAFAQNSKRRVMLCKHLMERHQQNDSNTVEAVELSLATEKHATHIIAACRGALQDKDFQMRSCGFTRQCAEFDSVLPDIRSSLSHIQEPQQREMQTRILPDIRSSLSHIQEPQHKEMKIKKTVVQADIHKTMPALVQVQKRTIHDMLQEILSRLPAIPAPKVVAQNAHDMLQEIVTRLHVSHAPNLASQNEVVGWSSPSHVHEHEIFEDAYTESFAYAPAFEADGRSQDLIIRRMEAALEGDTKTHTTQLQKFDYIATRICEEMTGLCLGLRFHMTSAGEFVRVS